jgi:hypothetical protein
MPSQTDQPEPAEERMNTPNTPLLAAEQTAPALGDASTGRRCPPRPDCVVKTVGDHWRDLGNGRMQLAALSRQYLAWFAAHPQPQFQFTHIPCVPHQKDECK